MAKRNELLNVIRKNWAGNRLVGGKFINIHRKPSAVKSISDWSTPFAKEHSIINYGKKWQPPTIELKSVDSLTRNSIVWLGHNSFLMNMGGVTLILDPVFGNIPFVWRKSRLPLDKNEFKGVDLLLVSHDHYDHMDRKSIKLLAKNNNHIQIVIGLGFEKLLRKWLPYPKINEMGWYQQLDFKGIKITFLPSQHWSKRGANDSAKRLWGAFLIEADGIKVYYSGDTGYADHFKEIKELFGKIDYALIGIGAYKPRWFLERNHLSPIEALKASQQMEARVTIPMHYGTFKLSEEPLFDPPIVFKAEALHRGIKIEVPAIGEILQLSSQE